MNQASNYFSDSYLDLLPVGVCIISRSFLVTKWNKTLEDWTGISLDRVFNKRLTDFAPKFSDPLITERIQIAFAGGGPVLFSSRFHPHMFPGRSEHQSEARFQRTTVIPFGISENESSAIIVVEDVSQVTDQVLSYRQIQELIVRELEERKKAERSLAIANNKLNTLASINRHDLQNLLMAFDGYITFAMKKEPNDAVKGYLEKMQRVADVMKKQIAFTRDYQDMGIKAPEWYNVTDLAESSIGRMLIEKVELVCDTGTLKIMADPLIQKAMYNLMENAVRHGGHTTKITISYEKKGDALALIIQDNGKGVAENIKNRIFERGFGSNTGLGLFLTKEILAITGISIVENGVEGEGARFELQIPKEFYIE